MSDFAKFLAKAYLRKFLTVLGTYLLTRGILSDGDADGFAEKYLEPVFGGLLLAVSAGWTYAYQWYVRRKVVAALELPPGASKAQLEQMVKEHAPAPLK